MGSESREIIPSLVPVQKRIIEWGEDGPILTAQPVLTKRHLQDLYFVVAAQPFVCEDKDDSDFKYNGLTIAEVIVRKQFASAAKTGSSDEIEKVMNRLLGNPKQITESIHANVNYEDWLKAQATKDAAPVVDAVEIEPSIFGDLG